jgi:hypothetical protein
VLEREDQNIKCVRQEKERKRKEKDMALAGKNPKEDQRLVVLTHSFNHTFFLFLLMYA